jgi:3-oxoacyl-[acyl-carrier-protein] synthase-3
MATIKYHNVGIRALAACVPQKVVSNKDLGYLIPEEEIEKTIREKEEEINKLKSHRL